MSLSSSNRTSTGHWPLGYGHQEQAWKRLSSQHLAASTLVATGTGSGKTECFLFPVMDHCARECAAGQAGIKTLAIYPMNALATDQARRMAALVAQVPAFNGLRVGLYVGGTAGKPGEGIMMTPTGVITDRDTLRKHPPDILLTNCKMLDYLMLRPRDRQLRAHNTPTTLRYVVVDELHTLGPCKSARMPLGRPVSRSSSRSLVTRTIPPRLWRHWRPGASRRRPEGRRRRPSWARAVPAADGRHEVCEPRQRKSAVKRVRSFAAGYWSGVDVNKDQLAIGVHPRLEAMDAPCVTIQELPIQRSAAVETPTSRNFRRVKALFRP